MDHSPEKKNYADANVVLLETIPKSVKVHKFQFLNLPIWLVETRYVLQPPYFSKYLNFRAYYLCRILLEADIYFSIYQVGLKWNQKNLDQGKWYNILWTCHVQTKITAIFFGSIWRAPFRYCLSWWSRVFNVLTVFYQSWLRPGLVMFAALWG